MTEAVHPAAIALWRRLVGADDRVLVLGATGWFGRTTVAMLDPATPRMLVASRARDFDLLGRTVTAAAWDDDGVRAFEPTVVMDCAFLTRDLVAGMSLEDYVARNTELTERLLAVSALPSVRRVLTVSSGAAVFPEDALTVPLEQNPYGRLKREAEVALAELGERRGIATGIARAWSVSGAFVQKPRSYALTDMILQALDGGIHISATVPVFRRYVSVEDLIAVTLAQVEPGRSVLVDSGGPLVEMAELAEAVAAVLNPDATITRAQLTDGPANRYYASAEPWDAACAAAGFAAAGLHEQIAAAAAGVVPTR